MDPPDSPSCFFFSLILVSSFTLYGLFKNVLKHALARVWLKKHTLVVQNEVSMRIVSSTQAILACICGAVIMKECYMDKLHARSWLVEPYGFSMTGYLWYDTWAMFTTFRTNPLNVSPTKHLPLWKLFHRFVLEDPAMMVHHILLPVIFLPILVFYRRGLGDYYIGMFLFIEAFIPFASLRDILVMLNRKQSSLYLFNGVTTVIVYTLCRICMFPFMLWTHGGEIGQPFYWVPWHIPRVCNIGTVALVSLFVYWWAMILRIAYEEVKSVIRRSAVKNREQQDRTQNAGWLEKKCE